MKLEITSEKMSDQIIETTDVISVPILDPKYTAFIEGVEKIVQDVKDNKAFEQGFQFINDLLVQGKALDDSIGMMLNAMNDVWEPEKYDGKSFEDATLHETGLRKVTIQRHIKVQRALPVVPVEYREEIQEKGFKEKIRIAQLVEGGYEVTEEDWRDLAEAPDAKEVDRISRKIRGAEPRSNWLAISINDNGVLRVHTVRGTRECGRLNSWDDDPDVQKAISRLLGCTGVQPTTEY